jgi:hypothetical protein
MLRQTLIAGGLFALCGPGIVFAQPPGPRRGERGGPGGGGVEAAVTKLMVFDADKDGKLSQAEVTDTRLTPLWERCDADKDGVVTKDELTAQLTKEAATLGSGRGGPGGSGPGGGFGGPGGPPAGGPEGGPRFGGPPAPGQILPPFLQEELRLSEAQRQQLTELQKDVDTKLAQILTREQRQQLRDMANRGPRGFGGPGGPPAGGPGGNRPPGEGRPQRPPQ